MPREIEYNGFDETGQVGSDIFFVRTGMDRDNFLKPYIYNILHFGDLIVNKRDLIGRPEKQKTRFVRQILQDPSIQVDYYRFSVEEQTELMKFILLKEFETAFQHRGKLIELMFDNRAGFIKALEDDDNETLKPIYRLLNHSKNFEKPVLFLEWFIKSYAYRRIFPSLASRSKILRNPTFTDYRVFTFIDGGNPFSFWYHKFLSENRNPRFGMSKTPIFGLSNGDEYFSPIMVSGNLATLMNASSFPHNFVSMPDYRVNLEEFYNDYLNSLRYPKYHNRIIFIGNIPKELKFSLPAILHIKSGYYKICEPFDLHYSGKNSFRTFTKKFGKITDEDTIITGKIESSRHVSIMDELIANDLDGRTHRFREYEDDFYDFINMLDEKAQLSNLDENQKNKITTRLKRAKERVKSFIEKT
ncbi:MAG: hypothetical protein GXO65_01685 [Euryarchaeota archaeon]|nr:hypothetical protein [Euryarchaeota archaeon]